ncbi:MAG: deoxyribose-phosphate aldolase [Planctomycetota bacterium]|jgi:deoxyribose-phosphate aldolase|nr:MAG: deoxyribose-phosphate aldolase [Planctomycetota bacterium]
MSPRTVADVARVLDHAVLKPELTAADLARHAAMCVSRGVGCLCVRSCDAAEAVRLVANSPVVVAAVIGFPHGAQRPEVKALEARLAIADGARELDMVMNVGAFLSGREVAVRDDIAAVVAEARTQDVIVKVILETCYLPVERIAAACRLAEEAGADFVKTSTGFGVKPSGPTGATPEAVRIMLDAVGGRMQVKASGGIRTWAEAIRYLDMGCTRLGVGDAPAILDGRPVDKAAAY